MKKDNRQRLFEVMERVDPSFSSMRNENDDIEKMFSPEEFKKMEKADIEDLEDFNQTMDSESPHYDLKNRGQEFDDEIIKDLADKIHNYFL